MRFFSLLSRAAAVLLAAAMLLPALSAARGSAKSSGCIANLRQIGTAMEMYSNEHEDWVCPGRGGHLNTDIKWFEILAPSDGAPYGISFKNKKGSVNSVLMCPGEATPIGKYANNEFQYSHYVSNVYVMPNVGMKGNGGLGRAYYFKNHQFEDPSAIHTVGDSAYISGFSFSYTSMLSFRHGGGDGRIKAENTPLPTGGLCNMLFLDGHVESMSLNTMLNGFSFGSAGYVRRPGTKKEYYGHPNIKGVAPVEPAS